LEPDELDKLEKPLLLHPYQGGEDNPRRHLCFGISGIEAPRDIAGVISAKGAISIKVYNLYDPQLRRKRDRAQRDACKTFLMALGAAAANRQNPRESARSVWATCVDLSEIKAGKFEYPAAALDYVEIGCKSIGALSFR
jgi:hypothetical protein